MVEASKGDYMGWFSKVKEPETVIEYELDDAKRIIGLSVDDYLTDEHVWRVKMAQADLPDAQGYLVGNIKNEGTAVGVFIGKTRVGQLDDRWLPSAVKILRKHGGQTAPCVVSRVTNGWNVYVNMA